MLVGVVGGQYKAVGDKWRPYNGRQKLKGQFWPINIPIPLILPKKKKKDFGQLEHFLGIFFSLSLFSLYFSSKNTFDSCLFTNISLLGSTPWI